MKLDIVIPFYNPSAGWEKKFTAKYLKLADTCLSDIKEDINLIIVNDGSSKHFTVTESQYIQEHIPHVQIVSYDHNMGKGHALRKGVEQSTTEYCIYTDYDFPFGLQVVRDMYDELQRGTDIVTGCRRKGNYFSSLPFKRKMVSKGLIVFNRQFLRLPVYDTQAGIKGFNKYGRAMFLKTTINRFLFDMEFILISSKIKGMVIKSLSVNITHETKLSDFGMKVMRQEFKNLLSIVFRKKDGTARKEDII